MAELKDKVTRKNLPVGQDGEALVLDSNSADGLRWVPGVDRLITDITPELSGDLDANDNSITDINNLTFHDGQGEVAGIDNENLVDKTAAETINGAWTHGAAIAMGGNKITGVGDPTLDQDAATKKYLDDSLGGYFSGTVTVPVGSLGTGFATNVLNSATTALTTWTFHRNSGWSDSGGELTYGLEYGPGTQVFLVNWSLSIHLYSLHQNICAFGKIQKEPSGGGGFADVGGSLSVSNPDSYGSFYAYYVYYHRVEGSCIVSLSSGDSLRFTHGTYGLGVPLAPYAVNAFATPANTPGATITITTLGFGE